MKVTVGPAQYIRNKGVLEEAGTYIKNFGKTAALIGGHTIRGKRISMKLATIEKDI